MSSQNYADKQSTPIVCTFRTPTEECQKLCFYTVLAFISFNINCYSILNSENPASDEDDYRLEVLIALRKIERLDKDEYTDEERTEAQDVYEQRRQEEIDAAKEVSI